MSKRAFRDTRPRKSCAWSCKLLLVVVANSWNYHFRNNKSHDSAVESWESGNSELSQNSSSNHGKARPPNSRNPNFSRSFTKSLIQRDSTELFQSHTGQPSASRIRAKVEWIRLPGAAAGSGPRALGQAHPAGKSTKSHHGPRPLTFRLTQPTNQVFTHKR